MLTIRIMVVPLRLLPTTKIVRPSRSGRPGSRSPTSTYDRSYFSSSVNGSLTAEANFHIPESIARTPSHRPRKAYWEHL